MEEWYVAYCLEEFGTSPDESRAAFMDAKEGYSNLGVLYSTYTDNGEHDIEVECDLLRGVTIVRADNEIIYCEKTKEEFDDFQSIYDWAVALAKEN